MNSAYYNLTFVLALKYIIILFMPLFLLIWEKKKTLTIWLQKIIFPIPLRLCGCKFFRIFFLNLHSNSYSYHSDCHRKIHEKSLSEPDVTFVCWQLHTYVFVRLRSKPKFFPPHTEIKKNQVNSDGSFSFYRFSVSRYSKKKTELFLHILKRKQKQINRSLAVPDAKEINPDISAQLPESIISFLN